MVTKEQVKAVWKCSVEGCDYTADPTVEGHRKLSGHQLAHRGLPKTKRGFQLVDERTGEILAQKLEEAVEKGLVAPQALEPEAKPDPEEVEETIKAEITTISTAGIFTYEITLPADAFTLYNLAKACGLEKDGEKTFDEWVWDCIRARYAKDYKKQLILAPVEE